MTKRIAIIAESKDISKFIKKIDAQTIVIGWNEDVCQELKKRKINYKSLKEVYHYDHNLGIRWIKELGKKTSRKNNNLISTFEFKETSLWWWMEYWLYESYAYYDSFKQVTKVFHIIYNLLIKEKPEEVIYITDGKLIDKTIKIIADKLNIKTREIRSNFELVQFKTIKIIKINLIKIFFNIRFIIRKRLWKILNIDSNVKRPNQNKIPLLIINWSSFRDEDCIKPIIEEIDKNKYDVYALDIASNTFLEWSLFTKKRKENVLKHLLLENYIKKSELAQVKNFKFQWDILRKDNYFKELFEINDINIWSLVEPQLSAYFNVRLKDHLIHLIAIDNIIKKIKPKYVITPAETSEFDKSLFLACQKASIPVIAVQHGVINNDLRCMHDVGEVSLDKIKPNYCPIPTITAVYGQSDKDFLIKKGHYPEDSIVITGNQRYDFLPKKTEEYNKAEVLKKFGLHPSKRVILFITCPFSSEIDIQILTEEIIREVSSLENVQLIIKVHPVENENNYIDMVKNTKNTIKVIKKADMFELLFVSDISITTYSNSAIESMIMNKPLIVMNLTGTDYPQDYSKEGAAIKITKNGLLKEKIKELLYDEKSKEELLRKAKQYLDKNLYKVDGKASERIVNIVNKLN
jgi:hypothetical protein